MQTKLCKFKECGRYWHFCYFDETDGLTDDISGSVYCIYCESYQDCYCYPCNNPDCGECK